MEDGRRCPDLLVVGAGPAGLTAALFARDRGLDVIVLEGAEAGGQLRSVYPHKPIYNYPGSLGVTAGELARRMVEQVVAAGIPLTEHCPVESLEPRGGLIRMRTRAGEITSRAALVASGIGLFEPRRMGAPGEELEAGRTVFYTIADPAQWRDLEVVVFGGGDSAVDNALLLGRSGARVTLVHRKQELMAQVQSVRQLEVEGIRTLLGWNVASLSGGGESLLVDLTATSANERCTLSVDRALVNVGAVAKAGFLSTFADGARVRVRVDSEMRTPAPGVFACGDVADYPGKVRLIVTAVGEAATATASVERYLKGHGPSEAHAEPGRETQGE